MILKQNYTNYNYPKPYTRTSLKHANRSFSFLVARAFGILFKFSPNLTSFLVCDQNNNLDWRVLIESSRGIDGLYYGGTTIKFEGMNIFVGPYYRADILSIPIALTNSLPWTHCSSVSTFNVQVTFHQPSIIFFHLAMNKLWVYWI